MANRPEDSNEAAAKIPGEILEESGTGERPDEPRLIVAPPELPVMDPALPPHPQKRAPGALENANYGKSMMASSAVTSFLMPIVTFCLAGYWLDARLKHATPWLAIIGVVVGMILGVTSLLRVLNRISK